MDANISSTAWNKKFPSTSAAQGPAFAYLASCTSFPNTSCSSSSTSCSTWEGKHSTTPPPAWWPGCRMGIHIALGGRESSDLKRQATQAVKSYFNTKLPRNLTFGSYPKTNVSKRYLRRRRCRKAELKRSRNTTRGL